LGERACTEEEPRERRNISKKAQTWSNMGEKARWTTLDGHGQEIRKMEVKGHIMGSCSSVYDNVHVHRQKCANMEQPGRTDKMGDQGRTCTENP
jgi:hypothetical protein